MCKIINSKWRKFTHRDLYTYFVRNRLMKRGETYKTQLAKSVKTSVTLFSPFSLWGRRSKRQWITDTKLGVVSLIKLELVYRISLNRSSFSVHANACHFIKERSKEEEKKANRETLSSFVGIYRTHHHHFHFAWATLSDQSSLSFRWLIEFADLCCFQSRMLNQVYLVTPGPFFNSSFFW